MIGLFCFFAVLNIPKPDASFFRTVFVVPIVKRFAFYRSIIARIEAVTHVLHAAIAVCRMLLVRIRALDCFLVGIAAPSDVAMTRVDLVRSRTLWICLVGITSYAEWWQVVTN